MSILLWESLTGDVEQHEQTLQKDSLPHVTRKTRVYPIRSFHRCLLFSRTIALPIAVGKVGCSYHTYLLAYEFKDFLCTY